MTFFACSIYNWFYSIYYLHFYSSSKTGCKRGMLLRRFYSSRILCRIFPLTTRICLEVFVNVLCSLRKYSTSNFAFTFSPWWYWIPSLCRFMSYVPFLRCEASESFLLPLELRWDLAFVEIPFFEDAVEVLFSDGVRFFVGVMELLILIWYVGSSDSGSDLRPGCLKEWFLGCDFDLILATYGFCPDYIVLVNFMNWLPFNGDCLFILFYIFFIIKKI